MRLFLIGVFIQISLISSGQTNSARVVLGEEAARNELQRSLGDSTLHTVVDKRKDLIAQEEMAVSIAETILFQVYGQKAIERQRPYEIYKIGKYWSVSGTLPRGKRGGTFLIILDARDSRVVRLTHGK